MIRHYVCLGLAWLGLQALYAQNPVSPAIQNEWNDPVIQQLYVPSSPWGQFSQQSEDISKRTQNSKHFPTGGGNYKGFLAAGPVHFQENNDWLTIATDIVPNTSGNHSAYGHYNRWNAFKTYYGSSNQGVRVVMPNSQTVDLSQNPQIQFVDANGNSLGNLGAANQNGTAQAQQLTYGNVFAGVDVRFEQMAQGFENSYLLNNGQVLQSLPSGTEYVSFTETISLPVGWTVTGKNPKGNNTFEAIEVKYLNDIMLFFQKPRYFENLAAVRDQQGNTERKITGSYRFQQSGTQLMVQTLVPANWLTAAERKFPITIDPTINIYPYAAALATQEIEDAVSNPRVGFFDGTFGNTYYKSAMDFDTSPIPDVNASGVTAICNVTLFMYQIGYEGPTNCSSCSNPNGSFTFVSMLGGFPVAAQPYGTLNTEIYNGLPYSAQYGWGGQGPYTYNTNNAWKQFPLNFQARKDMTDLLNTDHFPVGLRNDYLNHSDPTLCQIFTICDDDDYVTWQGNTQPATQPYLVVDYQSSLALPVPSANAACGNGTDANPNNDWIMLAYEGTDLTLTNNTVYYDGFASFGGLNINSGSLYNVNNSPSGTAGFQGCGVPNDNHITVYRRCGFPCGQYNLDITNINGSGQFYLNGNFVTAFTGNLNLLTNAILDANSSIEIRYLSTTGASTLTAQFTRLDDWKATAGNNIQTCPGSAINLSAGVNGAGTAGFMPCSSGPAGSCGPTAYSWVSNCAGFPNGAGTPNVNFNFQGGSCDVYLIITSQIGCTSTDTVTISELPTPTVNASAQFSSICSGGNAVLLLSNSPANTAFCISVLNGNTTAPQCPNSITAPGGQISLPITLPVGTATPQQVQIIVQPSLPAPSCPGIPDTVTITVNPLPQLLVSGPSSLCSGDNLNIGLFNTLNPNSAFTWTRTNNAITCLGMNGNVLPPNSAITGQLCNTTGAPQTTTFTLNSLGGACAAAPATLTITVNPNPTASITSTSSCTGATLTAQPAGNTYSWSNGQTTQSITANLAGLYEVWVTNAQGCTSQASTNISTSPLAAIYTNPANTTSSCGGSIQMTAVPQSPNYIYAWNPSNCTGPSCTVSTPGTYLYTVTATDITNGCSTTSAPLSITIYPKPDIGLGSSTGSPSGMCEVPNATLNTTFLPGGGTVAPYSYNWFTMSAGNTWVPMSGVPASQSSIAASFTSSAYVTQYFQAVITDANGCQDTTNIFAINQNPNIALTALQANTTACEGDTLAFTYTSDIGGFFNCGALGGGSPSCNNGNMFATQSGTYWVMCVAPNGCTDTVYTPALSFNPTPVVTISYPGSEDSILCRNESIVLTANPTTLSSYQWYLNGSQLPNATAATYTANLEGTYSVMAANSFGCAGMGTQGILVVDTLLTNIVSSQPDLAFCQGQDEAVLTAPQGGSTYVWTMGSNNYVGNPFTVNGNNYQAPGNVNLTVTNAAGCVSRATISIKMDTLPKPTILQAFGTGNLNLCIGDTLTLNGIGGPSWAWRKDGLPLSGGSAANYTIVASADLSWAGNYQLIVVNAGGCRGESQVFVVGVNPEPYGTSYSVGNTHICKGQSVILVASQLTGTPKWLLNGVEIPGSNGQGQIVATEPGEYNVIVSNVCGDYLVPNPINITRNDDILANFKYNPQVVHVDENVFFTNLSTGGLYANWLFGDGVQTTSYNPVHQFGVEGEYQVRLTISDELGCADDTVQNVKVIPWGDLFIPNTFTPNGDGSHDNFEIYYADLEGISLQIFDRWGQTLYETTRKDQFWDGLNNEGRQCAAGVYYYVLTASKPNGDKVTYKGFVNLLR